MCRVRRFSIHMSLTLPPHHIRSFFDALAASERLCLTSLRTHARQTPPPGCLVLRSGTQILGLLLPEHARALVAVLGHCDLQGADVVWNTQDLDPEHRSAELQAALRRLRDQGRVTGWRDEDFGFWSGSDPNPNPGQPAFLQVERAGFRFLGMMSHAVHINGFTPDGRMWCGQRSVHKATDPGLWDNLTAGGLAAGETLARCAQRELWEEAGYRLVPKHLLAAGRVRISRATPTGWHDEMLHIFNLCLDSDFVPSNQDGEVQAFDCLSATEVMTRISSGQLTADAALAIAQGVLTENHP